LDELSEAETAKDQTIMLSIFGLFCFFSRDHGKRFVVRADEKLTAFLETERAIHQFAVSLLS
jgi:hypothetical protein